MSNQISFSGNNLEIVIRVNNHTKPWTVFTCWYSIKKNLPDARCWIKQDKTTNASLYTWLLPAKINLLAKKLDAPTLFIPAEVMALRELSEKSLTVMNQVGFSKTDKLTFYNENSGELYIPELYASCDTNEIATFINCEKHTSLWGWNDPIFDHHNPIESTTINETKMLELLTKSRFIYKMITS